jgi:hypothetical protein
VIESGLTTAGAVPSGVADDETGEVNEPDATV